MIAQLYIPTTRQFVKKTISVVTIIRNDGVALQKMMNKKSDLSEMDWIRSLTEIGIKDKEE